MDTQKIIELFDMPPKPFRTPFIRDEDSIKRQAKITGMILSCHSVQRELQNQSLKKLVDLCGSENYAATLLKRHPHIVQVRCFEMSEACQSMRTYWPDTEPSLLISIRAKMRLDFNRFNDYIIPFLKNKMGQKIIRRDFEILWKRALNDGLLPEEKKAKEAEELAELALMESSGIEVELAALRAEKNQLMIKLSILEEAAEKSSIQSKNNPNLPDAIAFDIEHLMAGKNTINLQSILRYAEFVLSDRLLILPSAWRSSQESDRSGFVHTDQAAHLLFKLARDCVDQYRQGGHFLPDTILGRNAYAINEGKGKLSHAGILARTFTYLGKTVFMENHLKINVGFNKGTTFRCHFCYDPELKKVVIGHFGKHLNR